MSKKTAKSVAQRKARKAMKKRTKEKQRQKTKVGVALSENAVQHKMLSEFGNVQNFVRNILHLSTLLATDDDLKTLRFDADKAYEGFDLAADRDALADIYAKADDLPAYDEQYEDYWRDKRRDVLENLVDDEFVERCEKLLNKLMVTKKGFKKDYRAVMAGKLLVQSHTVALSRSEAPLEDNNLWEMILLATLKENQRELPEPAPETEVEAAAEDGEAEQPAEPAEAPAEEKADETE